MNTDAIDPTARAGRFRRRFSFFDEELVIEQVERAAIEEGTSAASVVRSAIRGWLREHEDDDR